MSSRKKLTSVFPKTCCGVCGYSTMETTQLVCWGDPPKLYLDEAGGVVYDRGAPVDPTDHICSLFKPKEMA